MATPAIGTYIRPVGHYAYCYQVVKVLPADKQGPEQWWCKRFGYDSDTKRPVKDGHQSIHYLNNLKGVLPDVWRDEWEHSTPRWSCCPLYYRALRIEGQQRELF